VFPGLFEIPYLDAFEGAMPAGEVHKDSAPFWGDATIDEFFLGRTVTVVSDHTLKENGVAAHSQLKGAEGAIPAVDLDLLVISNTVNVSVTQEIPNYASSRERRAKGLSKAEGEQPNTQFLHVERLRRV
jgi:hypothetical protein